PFERAAPEGASDFSVLVRTARAGGRGPPPQSGCAQRSSRLAATPPPRWSPTGNHERPVPYCRHANYIEREEAEKRPPSWPDGWTNRGHFLRNRRGNRAIPPAERRPENVHGWSSHLAM